jgi:hypothetical protein
MHRPSLRYGDVFLDDLLVRSIREPAPRSPVDDRTRSLPIESCAMTGHPVAWKVGIQAMSSMRT